MSLLYWDTSKLPEAISETQYEVTTIEATLPPIHR